MICAADGVGCICCVELNELIGEQDQLVLVRHCITQHDTRLLLAMMSIGSSSNTAVTVVKNSKKSPAG